MNQKVAFHTFFSFIFLFTYLFQVLGLPVLHLLEVKEESDCHCIPIPQWETNCGDAPCEDHHHHHHHHHSEHCGICSIIFTFLSSLIPFIVLKIAFLLSSTLTYSPKHFKKRLALIYVRNRAPPRSHH